MKKYWVIDEESGYPDCSKGSTEAFFSPQQTERAEQILKAVEGMRICTALCLLDKCKAALMQSTVDMD